MNIPCDDCTTNILEAVMYDEVSCYLTCKQFKDWQKGINIQQEREITAPIALIKNLIEEYAACPEEIDSVKVAVECYDIAREDIYLEPSWHHRNTILGLK